jgi:hypothetical protein
VDQDTIRKIQDSKARYARSVQVTVAALAQLKKAKKQPAKQMPVINWFDGNLRKGEYTRVYAHCVFLDPHELRVYADGDEYTYYSACSLPAFGNLLPGNILRFFAYAHPREKFQQLYPLPTDILTPPAAAADISFPAQAADQRDAGIEAHPVVAKARAKYEGNLHKFEQAVEDAYETVAEQSRIGKASTELRDLLGAIVAKNAPNQASAPAQASGSNQTPAPQTSPAPPAVSQAPGAAAKVLDVAPPRQPPTDTRPRVVPAQPKEESSPTLLKKAGGKKKKKSKIPKNLKAGQAQNLQKLLSKD